MLIQISSTKEHSAASEQKLSESETKRGGCYEKVQVSTTITLKERKEIFFLKKTLRSEKFTIQASLLCLRSHSSDQIRFRCVAAVQ